MPFVHVYYPQDLFNKQDLKRVSLDIHHSLMDHFQVPEKDYFQMYFPYQADHLFFDPSYLLENGEKRTEKMIHIVITCGPGRTNVQKKNLYHSIANAISDHLNIPAADIFIILNETPVENWSFGQGIAQLMNMKKERR